MHLEHSDRSALERAFERIARAGHSVTPQRRAVAQALQASSRALTAREISQELEQTGEHVGVMTVYRTLGLLAEIGAAYILHDRAGDNPEAHYAFCSDLHHHHLICDGCWGVWEVPLCGLAEAEQRITQDTGFEVLGHSLDFYGTCQSCRTARDGGAAAQGESH